MCEVNMFYICFVGLYALAQWPVARAGAGSCPPTLPVDECGPRCGTRRPCSAAQLCCPTACGGAMCVDPVTERHFVTQEKPGKCPEEPRGHWICSDTCTGDADCPRALKCCPNRCGAQACQRPDPADPADPAVAAAEPINNE